MQTIVRPILSCARQGVRRLASMMLTKRQNQGSFPHCPDDLALCGQRPHCRAHLLHRHVARHLAWSRSLDPICDDSLTTTTNHWDKTSKTPRTAHITHSAQQLKKAERSRWQLQCSDGPDGIHGSRMSSLPNSFIYVLVMEKPSETDYWLTTSPPALVRPLLRTLRPA